jgi:electron transfer flavoprotein beta subunit
LDLPVLTYVSKIEKIGDDQIVTHRAVEGGHEVLEAPLPVLMTVVKEINTPRMPNFSGKMKAKKAEILLLTADDLGADEERLGLKGSPTRVVKIFRPQVARKGRIVSATTDPESAVDGLVDFLAGKAII